MTPADKSIANSVLNNPVERKTAEEEEEEERRKRIFDRFPRRNRTDYSKTPAKSPEVDANSASVPKPNNTPDWLLQVMRNMNAVGDPMHIIDKTLDLNDMDPDQNCLLMPLETLIQKDFLTPDETTIAEFVNDRIMGVAAFLVDQRAQLWSVFLRKRFLKSDSERWYLSYLLRGGWTDAVKANGMINGDNISVWSFRNNAGILCFALAPLTTDLKLCL